MAALKDLKANDRTKLFKRSIRLLPALAGRGAAPADAVAIAYNAAFLFYNMKHARPTFSPKQILRRYTLSEIALLCESIIKPDGIETGYNFNFEEAVK